MQASLTAAQGPKADASRTQDTAAKDPQPISAGPPPALVDNARKWTIMVTPAREDSPADETIEQVLDEDTQSALVRASSNERLDMPRMSASLASALITLNAKPSSMAHLLEGAEDGPGLVERAYSQLGSVAGQGPASFAAYNKSA
ncbi:hypothetical protein D1227_01840 [Henriciella mobilis]|nr:hypothetical protein D1231_01815 [Henriciella mobilis]RIJ25121.1 hypothetical protein D1227_01840 [Henriciella mobilis]